MPTYSYNYSAFTSSGGVVNGARLLDEVRGALANQAEYVNTDDDTSAAVISFASSLSAGEQTSLDAIVAAHTGQPVVASGSVGIENSILTDDVNGTIIIDDSTGNVLVNA